MAKNTHLSLQDRSVIQTGLSGHLPFKQIAAQIGKDPSTVSKEVRKHTEVLDIGAYGRGFNPCRFSMTCQKKFLCDRCIHAGKRCALCKECYLHCDEFEEYECPTLKKPPYVCNGCKTRHRCTYRKHDYDAVHAQAAYEKEMSESRQGLATDPMEIQRINDIISPLLKNGQSIHHICESNRDEIMLSERTVYNYLVQGLFDAGPLDLPRMVRMRPRKSKEIKKIDRNCLQDRTYEDFLAYTAANPDAQIVEMDTVIGKKGEKVLMTIYFRSSSLLLAFIHEHNTARAVLNTMNHLYDTLGRDLYCRLFPIILTDRGSEFTNPAALECDSNGELRSRVFYCDPSSPYQKGGIEVCHEMIRRILPKGTSFNNLTQSDVNYMISHINSYKREKLNNRSAYQMFSFLYGERVLDMLHIDEAAPDEIILTPKLFKF